VIIAPKDRRLLDNTSLENHSPVFEGQFNDNPCLVLQLPSARGRRVGRAVRWGTR